MQLSSSRRAVLRCQCGLTGPLSSVDSNIQIIHVCCLPRYLLLFVILVYLLVTLDVHFRKLCRSIVGPPSEVDWNAAWKEILYLWNERSGNFVANARVNTWSYITFQNYWNLPKHVASLPRHRWVQRLLSWHPFGTRRVGRPRNTWDSKIDAYCRYANLGSHLDSFVDFCRM